MWAGVIVVGLLILLVIVAIIAADSSGNAKFDVGVCFGVVLSMLLVIEIILLSEVLENPRPTAMDVYQGKTTLEFTIRDNVKIDSIVVFKDSLIIN